MVNIAPIIINMLTKIVFRSPSVDIKIISFEKYPEVKGKAAKDKIGSIIERVLPHLSLEFILRRMS
jgi:hypothetical protein